MSRYVALNETDSEDSVPNYRTAQTVPRSVLSACLYSLGLQQWLSPNADSEYAREAQQKCMGLYAAVLIQHGQYNPNDDRCGEPDWGNLRPFRQYIFEDFYYVPELFELGDFDTPDEMFDAVEQELIVHEFLNDIPPERDEEYVTAPYGPDADIETEP